MILGVLSVSVLVENICKWFDKSCYGSCNLLHLVSKSSLCGFWSVNLSSTFLKTEEFETIMLVGWRYVLHDKQAESWQANPFQCAHSTNTASFAVFKELTSRLLGCGFLVTILSSNKLVTNCVLFKWLGTSAAIVIKLWLSFRESQVGLRLCLSLQISRVLFTFHFKLLFPRVYL